MSLISPRMTSLIQACIKICINLRLSHICVCVCVWLKIFLPYFLCCCIRFFRSASPVNKLKKWLKLPPLPMDVGLAWVSVCVRWIHVYQYVVTFPFPYFTFRHVHEISYYRFLLPVIGIIISSSMSSIARTWAMLNFSYMVILVFSIHCLG